MTSKIRDFSSGLSKLQDVIGDSKNTPPKPRRSNNEKIAPSRAGKKSVSVYFEPIVKRQLAILAAEEDKTQSALLAEALNMLFRKYKKPPIAKA